MKFQDPPVAPSGNTAEVKWLTEAEALRANPGQWALVMEGMTTSVATNIKLGRLKAFTPAGSFEATSRACGDGKSDIYIRYVGGAA